MAARVYGGVKIIKDDWDNAVQSTAIPLVDTGDNRVTWDDTNSVWEVYIGGIKVLEITNGGDLRIKGEFREGQTL